MNEIQESTSETQTQITSFSIDTDVLLDMGVSSLQNEIYEEIQQYLKNFQTLENEIEKISDKLFLTKPVPVLLVGKKEGWLNILSKILEIFYFNRYLD